MKEMTVDEKGIYHLYLSLLKSWNEQDAGKYADLFTEDGNVIGFDGSQMNGQDEIKETLQSIFDYHSPNAFVGIVREIRFMNDQVALLRAVAGMHPPGKAEINAATNAIQSMMAIKQKGIWHIALFHNTPARFDGRPELAEKLTGELQKLL